MGVSQVVGAQIYGSDKIRFSVLSRNFPLPPLTMTSDVLSWETANFNFTAFRNCFGFRNGCYLILFRILCSIYVNETIMSG